MQKTAVFLERIRLGKFTEEAQKAFELLLTSTTATDQEKLDAMKELVEVTLKFGNKTDKQIFRKYGFLP